VRQLLEHEAEKLSQSSASSEPVDIGPEQMSTESSCTDATAAAATETSQQHTNVAEADSPAVTNPCISVTRTAPQRHYKEITTYGEILFNL